MVANLEDIISIARNDLEKVLPSISLQVEEIEEWNESGHYLVTFSYWARDNKPAPEFVGVTPGGVKAMEFKGSRNKSLSSDLLNPWRKHFKRVEVDPKENKVIAIRRNGSLNSVSNIVI